MPVDIEMTWNTDVMSGQISFVQNDLSVSYSLLTPVLVSLFTDARAAEDDPLPDPGNGDRRGWWGDATNLDKQGDSVGSKLWLLEREKSTDEVLSKAEQYIREALQWMLDEGIASAIDVVTERQATKVGSGLPILAFHVAISKPTGVTETFKFIQEWKAVAQ